MQLLFPDYQPIPINAKEKYFDYQPIGKTQRFLKGKPVFDADKIQGFYTIQWACRHFSLFALPIRYIENQLKNKVAAYFYQKGHQIALFNFIDLLEAFVNFTLKVKLPSCKKYVSKIIGKINRARSNGVDIENAIYQISQLYWDIDNKGLGAFLAQAVFGDAEFYNNYNKQLLDYRTYCGGSVFEQLKEVEKFLLYFKENKKSITTNTKATENAIKLYFSYLF